MHIPDGYISPQTCGISFALMAPGWAWASRKLKRTLRTEQVPLLSMAAAFSFVIMMFNIPFPGGTTGHVVGGTLAAVVLGPAAAVMAISVALVIQALFFQDGGLLALGANCFNLALVGPLLGYWVYRVGSLGAPVSSSRHSFAAGAGAYAGINASGVATAIMLGIQPILYQSPEGQPLYCPYGLVEALSAIGVAHLLVFGWVEAVMTGLIIAYLQKSDIPLAFTASARAS